MLWLFNIEKPSVVFEPYRLEEPLAWKNLDLKDNIESCPPTRNICIKLEWERNFYSSSSTSTLSHCYLGITYANKRSSLVAQMVKNPPAKQEIQVQSLGQEDPLKNEMATHSRILPWRIPWKEGPGGLHFMGSQRVEHDWVTKHACTLTNLVNQTVWDSLSSHLFSRLSLCVNVKKRKTYLKPETTSSLCPQIRSYLICPTTIIISILALSTWELSKALSVIFCSLSGKKNRHIQTSMAIPVVLFKKKSLHTYKSVLSFLK